MEITNEIKAKVFAQYFGQNIIANARNSGKPSIMTCGDLENIQHDRNYNYKLILKPISEITDEDAIELYLITHQRGYTNKDEFSVKRYEKSKQNKQTVSIEVVCLSTPDEHFNFEFENGDMLLYLHEIGKEPVINHRVNKTVLAYHYLQSKGYDLPQYLLDGRTLKQAELAIYEKEVTL